MLEYLLTFIQHNIFIIFFVALFLGIASVFSKKIKIVFFTLLGLGLTYFCLLCLYRWGIGIESLYEWSSKYVILVCHQLDIYTFLFVNHSFILTKVLEALSHHSLTETILCFTQLSIFISLVALTIIVVIPRIADEKITKIDIKRFNINKYPFFINTINRTQTRFILNSKLRC